MKTLYLDIFSGISGDMFLGALIDLGVETHALERELRKLGLKGYHLHVGRGRKSGIEGVKLDVHLSEAHDHGHDQGTHRHAHEHGHEAGSSQEERTFGQITELIGRSGLSPWVKEKSTAVFRRIAIAEGKIHGLPQEQVHFHEVGAVDSIVDIVGACVALEGLGKPRVCASAVVDGTGWVHCAHGRFPVPSPATLAILGAQGIGITQCEEPHELVTPTGAALLAEFAETFGPMQSLVAEKIGFGLGTRENQSRPNVLRAILGDSPDSGPAGELDWEQDTVAVLETNLDDINSEWLGHFVEKALAAGALDVFHTPIQMKKSRPGVLLTLLCPVAEADRFSELMLRETTAFGVRRRLAERRKLRREWVAVKTLFGEVKVKLGKLNGQTVQAAPEFESCKAAAASAGVPVKEVYEAVWKTLNG